MKIVYVVHGYTNSGGTERVLALKANYLVKYGYQVSIISLKGSGSKPFFDFDPAIQFYDLDIKNKQKNKPLFAQKIEELLREIKPDISISTGIGLTRYLYLSNDPSKKVLEMHFAKYRRKFYLATIDHTFLGRLIADIYCFRKNRMVKKYDRLVVLTDEDKKSWRNTPNLLVIPNPVSFVPKSYADLEAKRIIVVGRFTYQKGMDLLMPIWAKVASEFPNWVLSIYGSGDKKVKDKVEKQAKSLNLTNQVEICQPTIHIEDEFLNSSISLMTSRYEGFGMVIVEAMSCGVPVIAYACKCGPRDIITDGKDGFLIEPGHADGFADQLRTLIKDESLRKQMGLNARKSVQRFDTDIVMKKWIDLFETLCM